MERNAKVKIPTFVTQFEAGKEVTFYMVQIELGGIKWELKKRFNEFHDLNEALKRNHGNLPSLPGKTLLPVKKPEEIDKRRDGLEKFLQALAQKVDVYASQAFVRFLELDDHKPDLAINPLELTARITHMLMGYRDLYFSEDRKFYFSVTSDPSTVSRLDSYITNLNMPWDKKTEKDQVLLAVGNLEVWAKMKKGADRFYYERLFLKTFKSQAICMDYNEKLGLIAIGLDNGFIAVFTFDRSDPTKVGELVNEKVHGARVMRIVLDERTGLMYSIGEDKFLKVMDIKTTTVISEVFVSAKKLTEMVVDKKNKIGYCADRGGSIIVVNLGSNPPRVGQVVKTSSEGAIRGLEGDFPNKRLYCTCHDDGYIHIFKLFDPVDPEGRIEKTASIKGAPGPRVIRYWPERNELFVGHQDGLVSVFNPELNPSGPIYCKKEHDGNVNTIQIIDGENLVITGSGDKNVKFWNPPAKWNKDKTAPKKPQKKKFVIEEEEEDPKPVKKQPTKQEPKKPAQKKAKHSDDSGSSEGGYDSKPVSKPKPVQIDDDSPALKPAAPKKEPAPPPKQPEKKKKFVDEDSDEDLGGRWND